MPPPNSHVIRRDERQSTLYQRPRFGVGILEANAAYLFRTFLLVERPFNRTRWPQMTVAVCDAGIDGLASIADLACVTKNW